MLLQIEARHRLIAGGGVGLGYGIEHGHLRSSAFAGADPPAYFLARMHASALIDVGTRLTARAFYCAASRAGISSNRSSGAVQAS